VVPLVCLALHSGEFDEETARLAHFQSFNCRE
jgi:hypothetical protein